MYVSELELAFWRMTDQVEEKKQDTHLTQPVNLTDSLKSARDISKIVLDYQGNSQLSR